MSIHITTRRDVIKAVPASFKRQYGHRPNDHLFRSPRTIGYAIEALEALDVENCDAQAVNDIIGNRSWTAHDCDNCGKTCEVLVHLGEEPDYEARYQDLCEGCLGSALDLLKVK